MTPQEQWMEGFDDRFKFAGTYAMGLLQADNIKSFISSQIEAARREEREKLAREVRAMPELGSRGAFIRRSDVIDIITNHN